MSKRHAHTCKQTKGAYPNQAGAALPMVLVVITVLAIIATISFRSVSISTNYMIEIQKNLDQEFAFFSAEEEVIFTYLTSQQTQSGLYTAGQIDPSALAIGNADLSDLQDSGFWVSNGTARRVTTPAGRVRVHYRDGGGLMTLTGAQPDTLSVYFNALGLSSDQGRNLAAKIADYQDEDNTRQFQGAERADYRLLNRQAPTNSPIRTPEELAHILGADPLFSDTIWPKFIEHTTFGSEPTRLSTFAQSSFMAPVIAELQTGNPLFNIAFTLSLSSLSGFLFYRIIDIDRLSRSSDRPFGRFIVSDGLLSGAGGVNLAGSGVTIGRERIDDIEELYRTTPDLPK